MLGFFRTLLKKGPCPQNFLGQRKKPNSTFIFSTPAQTQVLMENLLIFLVAHADLGPCSALPTVTSKHYLIRTVVST